jgi:prophage regulatory protein
MTEALRVLRRPKVLDRTGLSTSEIYDRMARDEFPKPVRLGANTVAWVESEIDAWIRARIAERDGEAATTEITI